MPPPPIDINPAKCAGKPCLAGTRFTVAQLLAELAERPPDQDLAAVAENFDIDVDAARAALHWAAKQFDRSWVAGGPCSEDLIAIPHRQGHQRHVRP